MSNWGEITLSSTKSHKNSHKHWESLTIFQNRMWREGFKVYRTIPMAHLRATKLCGIALIFLSNMQYRLRHPSFVTLARATCLAAARSRRGSDSPPDCHSIPRRRFATQEKSWGYCKLRLVFSNLHIIYSIEICFCKFLPLHSASAGYLARAKRVFSFCIAKI